MRPLALSLLISFCLWGRPAPARILARLGNQLRSVQAQAGSAPVPSATDGGTSASDPALAGAELLAQKGSLGEAERATRKFLARHPDSGEGHFLLGHILFDQLRQKYAGEERQEGESFRYNDSVSGALAKTRDAMARESLAEFSAGARYRPATAFDLKIVALDYSLLKDNVAADKWLGMALRMRPKDAQGWFYLGRTKYSESQFAGAIEAFEQCLKLEPRNIAAEYNVGLSYEGLNQKDEAVQAYQNAIAWQEQSEAKSPEPFLYLARLYLSQNHPEKAVPYLREAAAAFPHVSLAHEELGKAYSLLHRLPEAQAELEAAVKLSPEKASLRCVLGQVYQRQHMTAQARTEFERCSALQNAQASRSKGTE